jgi:hypothetical protein
VVAATALPSGSVRRLGGAAFRAALGFALMSPLWAYLQIIRAHAAGGIPT